MYSAHVRFVGFVITFLILIECEGLHLRADGKVLKLFRLQEFILLLDLK